MPERPLARARLVAQGLITRPWASPAEAVEAFGLMQGQDLAGVMASAALRSTGSFADVVQDMEAGRLVRGYPMRGTVFLSPAADLRWITELCAGPTLRDACRRRERHHDFTADDIHRVLEAVSPLAAGRGVSRAEFQQQCREQGIDPSGGRAYHILFTLIAEGHLCYGPFEAGEQRIVLASQWLGPGISESFNGDEQAAIAELASRYFRTHGPASVGDFAWWTKLPLTRIRAALPQLADDVEALGDETYAREGLADEVARAGRAVAQPLLLPGFDEYILGYKDRLFAMDEATHVALVPGNNGVFKKSVVVDGVVRATWTTQGPAGRRRLLLTQLAGIPKAAEAGVRRRFAEYPFAC